MSPVLNVSRNKVNTFFTTFINIYIFFNIVLIYNYF